MNSPEIPSHEQNGDDHHVGDLEESFSGRFHVHGTGYVMAKIYMESCCALSYILSSNFLSPLTSLNAVALVILPRI